MMHKYNIHLRGRWCARHVATFIVIIFLKNRLRVPLYGSPLHRPSLISFCHFLFCFCFWVTAPNLEAISPCFKGSVWHKLGIWLEWDGTSDMGSCLGGRIVHESRGVFPVPATVRSLQNSLYDCPICVIQWQHFIMHSNEYKLRVF